MATNIPQCFKLKFGEAGATQSVLTLLSPGGGWGGVIFARGKFKFELFLSGLWYEPETL